MPSHRSARADQEGPDIPFDAFILVGATTVLVLSLFAGYVTNHLWLSEATLCMVLGTAFGMLLRGPLDSPEIVSHGPQILKETAHITLGIAVMGAALRLPPGWLGRNWSRLALVLLVGLPLMWLTTAALAGALLGAALFPALLIGALLAPTDPVVSFAIIGGKVADRCIREELRNLISAESGANDGLGMPFVMLSVLALAQGTQGLLTEWLLKDVLWEVGGAAAMGAAAGYLTGRVFVWAKSKPDAEQQSLLAVSVALALAVLSLGRLLGSDGVLAVFVAGLTFNRHISEIETEQERLQGAISRFFDLPVFVLFGTMLPWGAWAEHGWMPLAFAAAVMAVRRLPWWYLFAWLTPGLAPRERLFAGWFGPVGVAAIYYALLSSQRTGAGWIWSVASLVICVSVVVHGVSATPLARWLGRNTPPDRLPSATIPG